MRTPPWCRLRMRASKAPVVRRVRSTGYGAAPVRNIRSIFRLRSARHSSFFAQAANGESKKNERGEAFVQLNGGWFGASLPLYPVASTSPPTRAASAIDTPLNRQEEEPGAQQAGDTHAQPATTLCDSPLPVSS